MLLWMIYSDVKETLVRFKTSCCDKLHCARCGLEDIDELGIVFMPSRAFLLCNDCQMLNQHAFTVAPADQSPAWYLQ